LILAPPHDSPTIAKLFLLLISSQLPYLLPMATFKIGQRVSWVSASGGVEKFKSGVIVAVIPAGALPDSSIRFSYPRPNGRRESSYLVQADNGKRYWPLVKNLRGAAIKMRNTWVGPVAENPPADFGARGTRCVAQWALVDMHTGEIWLADTCRLYRRPTAAELAKIKRGITKMRHSA